MPLFLTKWHFFLFLTLLGHTVAYIRPPPCTSGLSFSFRVLFPNGTQSLFNNTTSFWVRLKIDHDTHFYHFYWKRTPTLLGQHMSLFTRKNSILHKSGSLPYYPLWNTPTFWNIDFFLTKQTLFSTQNGCFTRENSNSQKLGLKPEIWRSFLAPVLWGCLSAPFGVDLSPRSKVEDCLNLFWGSPKPPRNPGPSCPEGNSPPVLFPPGFWCLPPVVFSHHTPYPSIAGEALPWTKTSNSRGGSHSISLIETFPWFEWPNPFRDGNFNRQLGSKIPILLIITCSILVWVSKTTSHIEP